MTVLRILRNFGHILNNTYIHIHFDAFNDFKFCDEVDNYLARYCTESVRHLSLCGKAAKLLLRNLHQPLTNVTTLKIFMVYEQQLNILLCIRKNFLPILKHLFLHNASRGLHSSGPIYFDNIETFSIDNNVGIMNRFPFLFERLKHLEFVCGIHLNDEFCELVRNIKHLTSLRIRCVTDESPGCFRKMLELPNLVATLEELLIRAKHDMFPGDILNFLERSRKLKTFTIFRENSYDLDVDGTLGKMESTWKAITSNLDFKWTCYVIDYRKQYKLHVIERISHPTDFQLDQISDI